MIERTTVRLPRELLGRAKRKALAEHRTLTSLIEEGLRLVVNDLQKKPKSKRVIPRTSSGNWRDLPPASISAIRPRFRKWTTWNTWSE